jgi:3-oxoacyl-[acyl-carrier-protein] synthase-3
VLFGDGAAASIIEAGGLGFAIEDVILGSDGTNAELIIVPGGGSKCPTSEQTILEKKQYLTMEGKEVFKHAIRRMGKVLEECLQRNHVSIDQIDYIIPHQANARIIDVIVKNMQCPEEKVWVTVDKIANTSASSIGLALDDLLSKKTFETGSLIALTAFGAGLTWGSALLKKINGEFHGKTR